MSRMKLGNFVSIKFPIVEEERTYKEENKQLQKTVLKSQSL